MSGSRVVSNFATPTWNEDFLLWSFSDTKAKKSTSNTRRWMTLEGWLEYYHTLSHTIVHWRKGKYIIQKISYFPTPCTLIFFMHWCINTSNLFTLPLDNYHNYHNRIFVNCIKISPLYILLCPFALRKHTQNNFIAFKRILLFFDDTLMSAIIMIDVFFFNMLFSIMQGSEF